MPQLTVRNVPVQVVSALKSRAAARGRSAEAEHRDFLHRALLGACTVERSAASSSAQGRSEVGLGPNTESARGLAALADGSDFATRAAAMRRRLRSSVDSTGTIRQERDADIRPN